MSSTSFEMAMSHENKTLDKEIKEGIDRNNQV